MATRPRDLYAVLEVDRKASQDDIKKAYRRLAREYHPDANPGDASAEERFKEVSQAYDVLADAEKRRSYDRAGVGGFTGGVRTGGAGAGGGFDVGGIGDIISDLFGNAARRGGGGGPPGRPAQATPGARARRGERGLAELRPGHGGRAGHDLRASDRRLRHVPGQRRQAGHEPPLVSQVPRARRGGRGPGPVLHFPSRVRAAGGEGWSSTTRARPARAAASTARSRDTA